ncbi:Cd(II)/Pb(II)-responsive transcriptional regulator [Allohahella sp. A8]|uniref:Cd(II)/Pb(II)-responsive transcriptional regulator n=1 Tax=Allohahella sp. A8 TaxID=3141461 RepID=UPI003A809EA0
MRISQLSRLGGVRTQTIRFYEQQGLLASPDRQENGYRAYTEKHVRQLTFIRRCRLLDLSLAEIRQLQKQQDDPNQSCSAINTLLDDHIADVATRIGALQTLEKQLISLRSRCNDDRQVERCGVLAEISEMDSAT